MGDALIPFLAAVVLGAYAQAVTGFALGIFVLGMVVLLDISTIAITATAMNFMTLATGAVVVLPRLRKVHWPLVNLTLASLIPATAVGVLALNYLSEHAQLMLRLLLGILIVGGGLVLVLRPQPRTEFSSRFSFLSMGALGGLLGGLFSVPAPPLVYQLYRQPIQILTIRATLIALFCIMGVARLIVVAVQGDVGMDVVKMGTVSVPVVLAGAWIGNRFPPPVSNTNIRRGAFLLLALMGGLIILTSLSR